MIRLYHFENRRCRKHAAYRWWISFSIETFIKTCYVQAHNWMKIFDSQHLSTSHYSNMEIVLNNCTDLDEENDDKDDYVNNEASPEIRILIIYEQPQYTGLHMTFTIDPTRTTGSLKSDFANIINVPAEFIILIHHNNHLINDKSLRSQAVQPHDTIVLRDSRLTYNFP